MCLEEPDRGALAYADVVVDDTTAFVLLTADRVVSQQAETLKELYMTCISFSSVYIILEWSASSTTYEKNKRVVRTVEKCLDARFNFLISDVHSPAFSFRC
jgi:hypothetical protein